MAGWVGGRLGITGPTTGSEWISLHLDPRSGLSAHHISAVQGCKLASVRAVWILKAGRPSAQA